MSLEYSAFLSIFIIGLSYGATACMFSCMPLVSPLLISNSSNTKEALGVILPFSIGRIFSYTLLAIIAYLSSAWVKEMLNNNQLFNIVLGYTTVIMGIYMFYKSFYQENKCASSMPIVKKSHLSKFGFFTIGATMAVNPCAPILALLAVAANSSSLSNSIGFGLFFGLGAVLFSIIFYAFIVSTLIKGLMLQFSHYKKIIERLAALLLISVGVAVVSGKIVL